MIFDPKVITHSIHPFVVSAHLREEAVQMDGISSRKVLVIDAVKGLSKKERDDLYMDFLANLDLISKKVEEDTGKFDCLDIRFH